MVLLWLCYVSEMVVRQWTLQLLQKEKPAHKGQAFQKLLTSVSNM